MNQSVFGSLEGHEPGRSIALSENQGRIGLWRCFEPLVVFEVVADGNMEKFATRAQDVQLGGDKKDDSIALLTAGSLPCHCIIITYRRMVK